MGSFPSGVSPVLKNGRLRKEVCERLVKTPRIPQAKSRPDAFYPGRGCGLPSHLISCAGVSWASAISYVVHQNPLAKLPWASPRLGIEALDPRLAPAWGGGMNWVVQESRWDGKEGCLLPCSCLPDPGIAPRQHPHQPQEHPARERVCPGWLGPRGVRCGWDCDERAPGRA